jgi:hypothetical protein
VSKAASTGGGFSASGARKNPIQINTASEYAAIEITINRGRNFGPESENLTPIRRAIEE